MAQYICRVCENNAWWQHPDNSAHEINRSHFANFSFAYEEWNFSPCLNINGYQYGWIEGFRPGQGRAHVPAGLHDVLLYVRSNGQALAVGRINACENITGNAGRPLYPGPLTAQANAVGANVVANPITGEWTVAPTHLNRGMGAYAQFPLPNVRFKLADANFLQNRIPIPIAYRRYGALLVTPANGRLAVWNMVP